VFLVADVHTEAPRVTRTKEDASARGAVSALHARVTPEGTAEAIFARGDSVFAARERGVRSRRLAGGAPVRLCASPSGRFLTVFTSLGKMLVVTADLSETATEFDAKSATPPEQVAWCGDDAAVMYWPTHLMIVGPHGSFISYAYDTPARLVSEVDGLRVITSRGQELVSRVPDPVVAASRSARGRHEPRRRTARRRRALRRRRAGIDPGRRERRRAARGASARVRDPDVRSVPRVTSSTRRGRRSYSARRVSGTRIFKESRET
jgi:hypothetical protein